MKRILTILIIVLIIGITIFIIVRKPHASAPVATQTQTQAADALVTEFGGHLKNVSVLAPNDVLLASIKAEYGPFVTPALLDRWTGDTSTAPGRQTSSPWPDHIDIVSTEMTGTDYEINGSVVLMTSNEVEHGGNTGIIPVHITVTNTPDGLKIAEYQESKEE